jgi:hypothetical protein
MLAHHLDGTDLSDQFFRNDHAHYRSLILQGFRYGIYLSVCYLFPYPVEALYLLTLYRLRLKFVRKLDDSFVCPISKVDNEAGKSRTFGYAETAAGAFS